MATKENTDVALKKLIDIMEGREATLTPDDAVIVFRLAISVSEGRVHDFWMAGMEDAAVLCDQEAHSAKALLAENPGARGEALARLEAIREAAEGLAQTIRTFKDAGDEEDDPLPASALPATRLREQPGE